MVSTDTHNEVPEATASATHGSNSLRAQPYVHFLDPDKIVLPDALSDQLLDQQQWSMNAQIQEPSLLSDVVPNYEAPTIVTVNRPVMSYMPIERPRFISWYINARSSVTLSGLELRDSAISEHVIRVMKVIWSNVTLPSDQLDIRRRLSELRDLRDGWADGAQNTRDWGSGFGKAPSHDGLDWLTEQFERFYPSDAPRPYIYPTAEGGIQAEWSLGDIESSLEIDIDAHTAEWFRADLKADSSGERIVNLDDPADCQWVAEQLRRDAN